MKTFRPFSCLSFSFTSVLPLSSCFLLSLIACRGETSKDPPVFGIRNMFDQQRYDMQSKSEFFDDKRTMRPVSMGVVSREQETNPELVEGRLEDNSAYVLMIPQAAVSQFAGMEGMLKRGEQTYNVYCAPCHDATGNGHGAVTERAQAGGAAAFAPPSFHQAKFRQMPDGQLYATIRNGKANMPPYGHVIDVPDRWAVVAWVRTLQLTNARLSGLGDASKPDDPAAVAPISAHHVEVKSDHVVIDQNIDFENGKSKVSDSSSALLDEIASVLKSDIGGAGHISKLEVQGHTSVEGDPQENVKLSQERSKAVVAELVKRGVSPESLVAKGYGSSKPIDLSSTPQAHAKNRRVEFVIMQVNHAPSVAAQQKPETKSEPHGGKP